MTAPSPPPSRIPAGATTAPPYAPLADSGIGDPSFYHLFWDDFDDSLGASGLWTVTNVNGGTVAHTAGDGGLALFTTGVASGNAEQIQLPAASFLLPQGVTAGKKLFFMCRLQVSDATNCNLIAGLCDTTTTLFTAITDGAYFYKPSGGTTIQFKTASGGTTLTWALPSAVNQLANATNVDLGFYVDRNQALRVFIGSQLYGYMPQSGTGAVNAVTGVSNLPVLGPQLWVGNPNSTSWTISAANLNVSLGIQTEAAAAKTMTVDFVGAAKER